LRERERNAKLENAAILYIDEQSKSKILEKEVTNLTHQLNVRNYARRKGFSSVVFKNTASYSEFLISKLPSQLTTISPDIIDIKRSKVGAGAFSSVELGFLKTLKINVAIKKSLGTSLHGEARVYQALSGKKNFLYFFGMLHGNSIVLELVQVYRQKTLQKVSSTLHYALTEFPRKHNWKKICSGILSGVITMHGMKILHNDIKEDNILIDGIGDSSTPKIVDFGKCTHVECPLIYNLSESQKRTYNIKHRHLAYELRNLNGFKQSFSTDAYSVGRIFKEIGGVSKIDKVVQAAKMLKVDDHKTRASLVDINIC